MRSSRRRYSGSFRSGKRGQRGGITSFAKITMFYYTLHPTPHTLPVGGFQIVRSFNQI
ncbi:MAG: hypothetical protein F6J93_06410 [Oscillatoria sp. SIO1A7]|nr:hypothetical protein [Oscillatoria sp. SIO1A7]